MPDFVGHGVHRNGENGAENAVFTRNSKVGTLDAIHLLTRPISNAGTDS
jgi:hypothetical protein